MTTGSHGDQAGGRSWPAPLLLVLVWLVGAVVATGVGVLAVRLVATQVGEPAVPPLSASAANPVPAGGPSSGSSTPPTGQPVEPPAPGPVAPQPPPPSPAGSARAFTSSGGTVGVSCSGPVARLLFAAPADGFTLHEQNVSGGDVDVRFESDRDRVRLELACANGAPVLVDERVDPAGGGPDDDG